MADKKRIPSISIESQEIRRRLEKCVIGDEVSYEELSALAMGDITEEKRFALQTARKALMHEKGMVFECIVGIGVKRLNDSEIIRTGENTLGRIHRLSHRGLEKLSCVNYDNLKPREQIEHNARFSALGALHHVTKPNQIKRLQGAVEKAAGRLQLEETLAAFDRDEKGDTFPAKLKVVK